MNTSHPTPVSILQLQLAAAAIVAAPLIYFLVCLLLDLFVFEEPGGLGIVTGASVTLLFAVGLAVSVAHIIGGHFLRRIMEQQAQDKSLATKMRIVLPTLFLGEAGACFGLVFYLLTGRLIEASVFMALGFASAITLFPTRRWLEDQ